MSELTPFTAAELSQLPVHFRYLRRQAIAAVGELQSAVRASASHRHQTCEYRANLLHKPLSATDYDALLAFVVAY